MFYKITLQKVKNGTQRGEPLGLENKKHNIVTDL